MNANSKPDKCILVVDDSPGVRRVVTRAVRAMGYGVVEAADGVEVLPAAARHNPDLIIMDVHMPQKDGLEALEALRADTRFRSLPVLMLTATTAEENVQKAVRLGAGGYLSKLDLKGKEVRARIRQLLGEEEGRPGADRDGPLRILLAQDNPSSRQLLEELLWGRGYGVVTAQNGEEVLDLLDRETGVDLVLMDEQMPRMNGLATAAAIRRKERANGGHVPIAILTGRAVETVRDAYREIGIDACVAKPVKTEELIAAIEEMSELKGERG